MFYLYFMSPPTGWNCGYEPRCLCRFESYRGCQFDKARL